MDDDFLVFIGDIERNKEWTVSRKPNFSDAITLSHQSPSLMNSPYQFIPLRDIDNEPIYFCGKNIQIIFNKNLLKVESEYSVPETEIYDALGHFVLLEGTRVSFLMKYPVEQTCLRKKVRIRTLSAAKRLKESEDSKIYGKIRVKL